MTGRIVDVAEVTGRADLSRLVVLIAAMCGLLAMCDGLDNQALGFTAPAIASDWGLKMPAFVPVFTIGLFGLMLGSLAGGFVGDRIGRRATLLVSALLFGVATVATPWANTLGELIIVRFVGGIGIGGLPAALTALVVEYAPGRHRASLTMWALVGIPAGGFLGGFAASYLIPHFGWQSVYYTAGFLSLSLVLLAASVVPESIHFLVLRKGSKAAIAARLNEIDPLGRYSEADSFVLPSSEAIRTSVKALFADGRMRMTLLFWAVELIELMIFYFLVNWGPTLFRESGIALGTAVLGAAALNSGAVLFTIALGPICRRFGDRPVTAATFVLTAIGLGVMVLGAGGVPSMMIGIFFAGAGCIGGQAAVSLLIANRYPTAIRALGVGWALTVGRIGSIISPSVVGIPLAMGWSAQQILMLPIIPALVGGVLVLYARPQRRKMPVGSLAASPQAGHS
jgi:AAHS family 4-hydroxybenzoate transporter-like MFS transporter